MEYTELKIHLMQHGAVFTANARKNMCRSRFGLITFFDYATTGGVVAVLDERIYVNIPVKFQGTPFLVDLEGCTDGLALKYNDRTVPISFRVIPPPRYALDNIRLSDNTPVRELVMTHADRTRISPVHGCAYHCSFCTSNAAYYKEIAVSQLDEAFQIALQDPYNRPRHVLISGGTPKPELKTYVWLNSIYKYFPHKYPDYDFDVMLAPRGMVPGQDSDEAYEEFLFFLKDECGFKTMSINLELYDDQLRNRFIPDKAEVGKDNYQRFISRAVDLFGSNCIRSSLVVGLEPQKDTLRGVSLLLDCGCMPVLSAFVPAPGTDMADYPAPTVEFLLDTVKKADRLAASAGLCLGPVCRPCTHNSLSIEDGQIDIPSFLQ